jgi:hypothetical protein
MFSMRSALRARPESRSAAARTSTFVGDLSHDGRELVLHTPRRSPEHEQMTDQRGQAREHRESRDDADHEPDDEPG